jgi:transcription-repair coupling factor (superfamily II helicase)
MSLHGLLDAVVKDTALAEAIPAAADGNRMHVDLVGPPAARAFAIAALARETSRTVLAVTATGREAEDLAAGLRSLLPPDGVVEYPSWETLPHERLSPRSDTVGRRLARRPARSPSSWPRSDRCSSRRSKASATSSPWP